MTEIGTFRGLYFPGACLLDVGVKPGIFRAFRRLIVLSVLWITHASVGDPYHLMVASHGHDPRHVLFLVTISTLLSYTVGITVTASLDLFTHLYASHKRNANARIFPHLGTDTVLDTVSSCSAPPARRASHPSSASPRYLLSIRNILIKAQAHHVPQTQFKEEDDDFLGKLHSEYDVGV